VRNEPRHTGTGFEAGEHDFIDSYRYQTDECDRQCVLIKKRYYPSKVSRNKTKSTGIPNTSGPSGATANVLDAIFMTLVWFRR
jgi:hypothetical protein